MSNAESNPTQKMDSKKPKLNDDGNKRDQNESAASNNEPTSFIFKMDIDCFEELFDYLSVNDLLAIRCTCKRFKKLVNYYIKMNCPNLMRAKLDDNNIEMFRQMDASTIELINQLTVSVGSDLDGNQFALIKDFLAKPRKIFIDKWQTNPDFYNIFLKYCTNVKILNINRRDFNPEVITSNEWLHHQYPSLEYISLKVVLKNEIDELETFFQLNPNIHGLSMHMDYLYQIGMRFVAAGITFDRIHFFEPYIDEVCMQFLKSLYDKGFYKRLNLDGDFLLDDPIDNPAESVMTLTHIGLEVMQSEYLIFTIPQMATLKELCFFQCCENMPHYENVKNNVERFNAGHATPNGIIAFVSKFPKLKHFYIKLMFHKVDLDLAAINKARESLPGACKTTIYVNGMVYLATKWTSKTTNFNLIELKREYVDWDQLVESEFCEKCGKYPYDND